MIDMREQEIVLVYCVDIRQAQRNPSFSELYGQTWKIGGKRSTFHSSYGGRGAWPGG